MTPKTVASPTASSTKAPEINSDVPQPTSPTLSPGAASFAPSTPAATFAATEDSDTDFQSAYSTSPRGSYYESDNGHDKASIVPAEVDDYQQMKAVAENAEIPSHVNGHIRERASSSATAIAKVTVRRPTVGNALVSD